MKQIHRPELLIAAALAWFGMTITPAVAATIIQTGTNVTEIDNIAILGNTYDVTFGTTIDTTFNTFSLATSAADAIRAVLNADPTDLTVGPNTFRFFVCSNASGPGSCDGDWAVNEITGPGGWNDVGTHTGVPVNVDNPAADFTLQGTPEPGAATTVGLGLVGIFLAVNRRRLSTAIRWQ